MAHEQLIRSFYDSINRKDIDAFVSFFAEDGQYNDVSSEKIYQGKDEIREMAQSWLKALPDMQLKLSQVISNNNSVCAEVILEGTHKGTLELPKGEIQATGKKVKVPSCDVINISNGKIQSLSCYFAATVLLEQVGAMTGRIAA